MVGVVPQCPRGHGRFEGLLSMQNLLHNLGWGAAFGGRSVGLQRPMTSALEIDVCKNFLGI